jgi:hypothetical protein
MTTHHRPDSVSRRIALAGIGAGGVGLAFAAASHGVAAQDAMPEGLAEHPLAGTWLAMANPLLPEDPQIAVPSLFAADGTVFLMFPLTQAGPQGVQVNTAAVGTWEADSERRGHFTAVQVLSDLDGTFLGTVTINGYPEVSEDGQTFLDDGAMVVVTIRDAAGAVLQEASGLGGRPVTAMRMGPGVPGFPATEAGAATPAP